MGDSFSVVNAGKFAKPVNTLIERISDAIGSCYAPWQIRRVAQAEADAALIHTKAQIEAAELQQRALIRFIQEEAVKQQNIEGITAKALPAVTDEAKPEQIDKDWLVNFFDKGRLVSDVEMQNLWASILAGEANNPGNYSRRTVNLLASFDKPDAELFKKLCNFSIVLGKPIPLIYQYGDEIYEKNGINFTGLTHLESLGLIRFDPLSGFFRMGLTGKGLVPYFNKRLWIGFPSSESNKLNIGQVLLSKSGEELFSVCGGTSIEGFPEYLKEKWKGMGLSVEPEIDP